MSAHDTGSATASRIRRHIRKRSRQSNRQKHQRAHSLFVEQLEDRTLLTTVDLLLVETWPPATPQSAAEYHGLQTPEAGLVAGNADGVFPLRFHDGATGKTQVAADVDATSMQALTEFDSPAQPDLTLSQNGQEESSALDVFDAGDNYSADGRQVPIHRLGGELTVKLEGAALFENILTAITANDSAEFTAALERSLSHDVFVLSIGGSVDAAQGFFEIQPDVSWVAPSFVNGETRTRQWLNGEVVVALNPGEDSRMFFASGDFDDYRPLWGTTDQFVATVSHGGLDVLALANALVLDPRVSWSTPNFFSDYQATAIPDDTLFGSQWHLRNTGQNGARSGADANLVSAWDTTAGSSEVIVAVVDSGVQTNHPDLRIFSNVDEIAGNGIDDDGNGYVDDVNGWDFHSNDNNPNPAAGTGDNHGTSVAGVATAAGNNSLGVAGASWNSKVLPVKISNNGAFATDAQIAESIRYAAGATKTGGTWRGADVINCSWGGGSPNTTLTNAFTWATTSGRGGLGTPVFVATGNSANNTNADSYVPFGITSVTGAWPSTWAWVLRYRTDVSGTAGDDTMRLGMWQHVDGSIHRFDSMTPPTGWIVDPFVNEDGWYIEDNVARAYGVARYQARPDAIGGNDSAYIMSPTFSTSGSTIPGVTAWIARSCETADLGEFLLFDVASSTLYSINATFSGANPPRTNGIMYPASIDSNVAVGASTDWDYRSNYSQFGTGIDLVAPSAGGYAGITTTDRTGSDGYGSGDYVTSFGGTSSATPLASGIGALLLSKNPRLSSVEVGSHLRDTANKIGGVTYTAGFNQYYGYGRVDASAALAAVAADTTGPIVSTVVLANDSGISSTDGITTDNTPVITYTFSERTVWNGSDVSVKAPDNSTVVPTSYRGSGTSTLTLVLPALAQQGQYTVTLLGSSSFKDQAGNKLNNGADHTYHFTLDNTPPQVESALFGDGTASRSMVTQIVVTFDGLVNIDSAAFAINKRGSGAVGVSSVVTTLAGKTIATLTFTGAYVESTGSLSDGYYDLTIDYTKVRDAAGNLLDGDNNGSPGGNYVIGDEEADNFFRLYGDTNGDGLVGIVEFGQFRASFGKTPGQLGYDWRFDFDGGGVGITDFGAFRARFGKPKLPWQ
jgi:subtilisin family serine protease